MQPDRFTIKSQEALAAATRLAQERRNPQVTPAHLLAVLLDSESAGGPADAAGGVVVPVLTKLGVRSRRCARSQAAPWMSSPASARAPPPKAASPPPN